MSRIRSSINVSVSKSNSVIYESNTPENEILSAKYKKSYAYKIVKEVLPAHLDNIIDDLEKKYDLLEKYEKAERHDLVTAMVELTILKAEMVNNLAITPFISPATDEPLWNKYLWQRCINTGGFTEQWFSSSWLYIECYMYRRIQLVFESSNTMKFYDPFRIQKEELLKRKLSDVGIVSNYITHILYVLHMSDLSVPSEELDEDFSLDIRQTFLQFLKMALWGNHFDSPHSISQRSEEEKNPMESLVEMDKKILIDDSEIVWEIVSNGDSEKRIDFVCDDAGYELFCDLCLADFLCTAHLASKIVFHVKAMPWFISDATVYDFRWLLHIISENVEVSATPLALSLRWSEYLETGIWVIKNDRFWTLPHTYCQMKEWDEDLYNDLHESHLIIFKGDVNYRKLLGERNWPTTTSFTTALEGFHPTNLVSLRTVQAELICGLKPGQAENLHAKEPDWMLTGDYAIIQFYGDEKTETKTYVKSIVEEIIDEVHKKSIREAVPEDTEVEAVPEDTEVEAVPEDTEVEADADTKAPDSHLKLIIEQIIDDALEKVLPSQRGSQASRENIAIKKSDVGKSFLDQI